MTKQPVYVVDASVFVADARPSEPFHADANTLLQFIANTQQVICAPTIVLPEIAAAITRGANNPDLAQRLVSVLRRLPHIQIMVVDDIVSDHAATLAANYSIRGCDAIYVALAELHHAILITLDNQQRNRVPSQVTARTPREALDKLV